MLRFLLCRVTRIIMSCGFMRLGIGMLTLVLFMEFFGFLKIMALT